MKIASNLLRDMNTKRYSSKMLIIYWILLINLLFATDVTIGQYCNSSENTSQAYSLGTNVFVGQGKVIWNFNSESKQIVNQKLSLKEIYGENTFDYVDTAFGFTFGLCDTAQDSKAQKSYCDTIDKARNIVIAIGQKTQETGYRKYGYLAYSIDSNNLLKRINETKVIWDLSSSGTLTGNFWVPIPGDLIYESSVFVVSRNELFVSVYDISSIGDSKYHLMSRKLQENGEWAKNWVEEAKQGFRGMFDINGRVFGMSNKNIVYEFDWSQQNITFNKISNMKELLNCFGNSTLIGISTNAPEVSITDNNSTAITSDSTTEKLSTNVSETKTTVQEIETTVQEIVTTVREIETTVQEIVTTVENSTTPQYPIAEQTKQEENSTLVSILIIGFILLIIIIVCVLIIIFRKKSKSQIIYLNATPTQANKTNSSLRVKTIRSDIE